MKQRTLEGFGERLTAIRKSRGLTQAELGDAVGVSNRVIAYYEQDQAQPPGPLLADLAQALHVSTDELLGIEPFRDKTSPGVARLRKRLRQVEKLPKADQQAVLKFVDALVETRQRPKKAAGGGR
jgi:transcriptional regulator with XRE-family HTH domain